MSVPLRLICFLGLVLLGLSPLHAALIQGKVLDEFRKTLPTVTVLVVNLDSGERFSAQSDPSGMFALEVPSGDYSVSLEAVPTEILKTGTLNGLHLIVPDVPTLQVELKIDFTKTGEPKLVLVGAPEPGPPSLVETNPELEAIRDYEIQLVRLDGSSGSTEDLEDVLNPFPAGRRGRLHGSIYEFHRNDNFDARNFFDPLGEPLPEYKRNQFGFSLAASPLPKLEVMGSYDGIRIVQGSTLLSHVPTAAMKRGDFSALVPDGIQLKDPLAGNAPFVNNQIPAGRIHTVANRLLSLIPDPNREDEDRNYVNNQPVINNQDSYSYKIDYQLAERGKMSFDYGLTDSNAVRVHPLPAFAADEEARSQDARLRLNNSFTKRLSFDLSFRFLRNRAIRMSRNAGQAGLVSSLGISGLAVDDVKDEGYPEFALADYADFGDQTSPITSFFNGFFTSVGAGYALEAHTVRFGTDFDFRELNNYRYGGSHRGRFVFNGYYTGDSFADFLLGIPEAASRAVGTDRSDLRGSNWQFYLRDNWKISPRFSTSFSLTYSVLPPYRSVHNRVSGFAPLLFEPPTDGTLVISGSSEAYRMGLPNRSGSMVFTDKNNWAPRLGFSYNPLGNSRLVLRGSYGISYESVGPGYFISYLGHNYPFYSFESVQASIDDPSINLSYPFETAVPVELTVRGIEPRLRSPYYQGWDLALQTEMFNHWSFQASYDGTKGTRMVRVIPGNVPLPGEGDYRARRPNPNYGRFTLVTNSGSYTAHSFDLEAERRFSGGFSLDSGFHWNRAFSDSFPGNPNNPRQLAAEKASAGFSPTRVLSLRYILDLPFGRGRFLAGSLENAWLQKVVDGWRLTGITRLQDGNPFTVLMSGDVNNDGLSGERPDRVGPGEIDPAHRTIDKWFVIEDFVQPAPYTFGNSGRNILLGPGYQNWDLSIIKNTRLADGDSVELRIELFNAFNQVNFDDPDPVLGTSNFGKIFGAGRAREIEVALKYSF